MAAPPWTRLYVFSGKPSRNNAECTIRRLETGLRRQTRRGRRKEARRCFFGGEFVGGAFALRKRPANASRVCTAGGGKRGFWFCEAPAVGFHSSPGRIPSVRLAGTARPTMGCMGGAVRPPAIPFRRGGGGGREIMENIGSSGILVDCVDGGGADGAVFRAWGTRKHSPPFFGGGRPVEGSAMGLCLRSKWKGRRGEYCGKPSMHASSLPSRRSLDSFVAGAESRLPRRPSAVLPPSRPLPFPFFHVWTSHSWPRHLPLGGGRILTPSLFLAFAEFGRRFH